MVKLTAHKSTDADCVYIAEHTRLSDIAEAKVTVGNDVAIYDVLHGSYNQSLPGFCITWFGPLNKPLAISGIVESAFKIGIPWMLGTIEMVKYPRQILIESRNFMKRALESRFEYLYNYVQDANESSKRYLKAIGFKLHELEPKGPYDALFRKFDMGNSQVGNTVLSGGDINGG